MYQLAQNSTKVQPTGFRASINALWFGVVGICELIKDVSPKLQYL